VAIRCARSFARDRIREWLKSGHQAARARGIVLGRKEGKRPSDKKSKRVISMYEESLAPLAEEAIARRLI